MNLLKLPEWAMKLELQVKMLTQHLEPFSFVKIILVTNTSNYASIDSASVYVNMTTAITLHSYAHTLGHVGHAQK